MSGRDDEDGERPWERRGAMRLDCEPHRGGFVRFMGSVSLAFGVGAFCCGVTGLIALPMGIAAYLMAQADLAKMSAGVMDRRGERKTRQGGRDAILGILLSLLFLAFYGLVAVSRWLASFDEW